jgi:thiosulfate/3-mercaptopyruvate sulfurtransferase
VRGTPKRVALPGSLVSGTWLARHAADVRIVDVRWYLDGRSGWNAYLSGHLPEAVWLDVDTDLAGAPSATAGRHPLPSEAAFARALGRMGITEGTPVVVYDDAGGSVAARLWWLLHSRGEPAAVLDGGIQAWPGVLTLVVPVPVPVIRPVRDWPAGRFVSADQVAAGLARDTVVYDSRVAERYAEGDPSLDPRPGHIPGAKSAPWAGNLGPDRRFSDSGTLRKRYADAVGHQAVAYCGSGVTACHDLLAMHVAGITDLALYPGSWSQWGADPSRPAETGAGDTP